MYSRAVGTGMPHPAWAPAINFREVIGYSLLTVLSSCGKPPLITSRTFDIR
jgi:hypothetical protein